MSPPCGGRAPTVSLANVAPKFNQIAAGELTKFMGDAASFKQYLVITEAYENCPDYNFYFLAGGTLSIDRRLDPFAPSVFYGGGPRFPKSLGSP